MKRAFVITSDLGLMSDLVPDHTPDALSVGDRITVSLPIDLGYAAQITAGEQGAVDFVDAATGFTEILIDAYHRGLAPWGNCIWLEPFSTEDILGAIILTARALQRVS